MLTKTLATAALLTALSPLAAGAAQAATPAAAIPTAKLAAATPLPAPLVLKPNLALLNAKPTTTTTKQTTTSYVKYTVKRGDTLYRVALAYKTTVAKIAAASKITNVNSLRVGQVLTIPQVRTVTVASGANLPAWQCKVFSGDSLLKPWVGKVRTRVNAQFKPTAIYGTRPGDPGDHGTGLALDVMVPNSGVLGDTVATWARLNAPKLQVNYVIWRQHIWAPYRDGEGWRPMADRGSVTANHYDHVHISFKNVPGVCPA